MKPTPTLARIALAIATLALAACMTGCETVANAFRKPEPPPVSRVITKNLDGSYTMTETPILVDTRDAFERAMDRMADGIKPIEGGNE